MEPEKLIREIIKANAEEAYQDSAQPSVRIVGKSLAQCVSLFATPVGRMAEIFEKNIHRYIDKLDGFKEDELVSPDTRILVPILDRMRFTDQEKVADYYAEILATASKKEHANKVMVTFIEILNRLTADEIKILEYIVSPSNNVKIPASTEKDIKKHGLDVGTETLNISGSFPVVDIKRETEGQTGYGVLVKNFNCLDEYIKFDAPENMNLYIDNMLSLGLIEKKPNYTFAIDKIYHYIENHSEIQKIKKKLETDPKIKIKLEKGRIDITDLGNKLLALCSSTKA